MSYERLARFSRNETSLALVWFENLLVHMEPVDRLGKNMNRSTGSRTDRPVPSEIVFDGIFADVAMFGSLHINTHLVQSPR